jgi:hypothetical protein
MFLLEEIFEQIKELIRPSFEEWQTIQWTKKQKQTNNGPHNTAPKTKEWATQTPLKTEVYSGYSEG